MGRFVFWETPPEVLAAAAPLYADLAALQMRLALIKLARKYRPDQPRVPAGSPDGGQWTDAGANGWVRVAANDSGEAGIATDAPTLSKPEQAGTHVILPDGKRVANPYSITGYLISPVADLSPVAEAGRQAGTIFRKCWLRPTRTYNRQPCLSLWLL